MSTKNLPSQVDQIVKDLIPYDVERIILFGSAARGDTDEYSDVDLVIIKKTDKGFVHRLQETGSYLTSSIHVDIFVYAPHELQNMIDEENPFIQNALRDGLVIYEKAP